MDMCYVSSLKYYSEHLKYSNFAYLLFMDLSVIDLYLLLVYYLGHIKY